MKKTYRIKTNNQEQLQRKQNESDATSRWIEFQKTRPRRRIQDKDVPNIEVLDSSKIYREKTKGIEREKKKKSVPSQKAILSCPR